MGCTIRLPFHYRGRLYFATVNSSDPVPSLHRARVVSDSGRTRAYVTLTLTTDEGGCLSLKVVDQVRTVN